MLSSTNNSYIPIPQIPATLGGQWRNTIRIPHFQTVMKFKAGTSLPPHHFPTSARITVLKGLIQIDDLQSSQAYVLQASESCMIPSLLVHEMQFLEDVEFKLELNKINDLVIYWDFEER
ncbi:hypothetical protein G6F56_001149 [Rhizopus delemar]|uniref:Cupin 2 conserved barrel domain-containing protein n=1 Tax=Rhizopus stolonifer TaxID=4846 RepID=A0A367KL61_RHIST|nr:hypothetical protein G6F56_001149 [Rhizopus delemar]RCI02898.1 hypothetical protein CU098_012587 [Rhizopus stolonifer]